MRGFALALALRARAALWRARAADRRRFVPLTLLLAIIEGGFIASVLTLAVTLLLLGAPIVALVLLALIAWLVVPHWLIETLAIPCGWHRAAWHLARFDPRGDAQTWPSLVAARAAARAGAPSDAVAWITGRLPARLDGAGIVVHALLAHGAGDRADARRLLHSLTALQAPGVDAQVIASEWLALDAAERGAWRELVDGIATWPATPLRYLLEAVAADRLGLPRAPGAALRWLRWLVAPAHRATWRYLRAAPSTRSTTTATTDAATAAPVEPAPTDARVAAATALVAAAQAPSPERAAAAVAAWREVLDDPAWLPAQLARAAALGLDPTAAVRTVGAARDGVIARLVQLTVTARAPLPAGDAGVAAAVRAGARARILDGLEIGFDRLHARVANEGGELAMIDEWREFLAVRDGYEAAVTPGGVELERVAYPHADTALGEWAVALWNRRRQHHVSHAITSWLFARAREVGDAAAVEHHGRNRALTIPDA
ncbi:MAG: hypothetical protein JNK64_04900 [Myxococcales bacterium]|nr:hypothetical protein [Myxococcales bacterium]